MNNTGYYQQFISENLSMRSLYEQLAEESSELSKAGLKMIRATKMSENRTPISAEEAKANLREEARDVGMLMLLLGVYPTIEEINNSPKWKRWYDRLNKGEESDE